MAWGSHIPGAIRRIAVARQRFEQLSESIVVYEALVEAQRKQLDILNAGVGNVEEVVEPESQQERDLATDEMLEQEEEAIRQLEQRKEEMELKIRNLDRQMSSVYRNA